MAHERKPAATKPGEAEQPLGRDERVSGWPATFEDVVRAMHRTPRTADKKPSQDKPSRDKGK